MYDRTRPLNEFIEEFNSISESINEFNQKYQTMVNQIGFITENILPRFKDRPAVFESVESMSASDVLLDGDICLTFNDGADANGTKYVEAYKVELKTKRPGDTFTALKNPLLGAYLIPTSGETDVILGQINAVSGELTTFKNTKGKASGLASLGTDGKLTAAQLPTIPIPPAPDKATEEKDGLMSKEDKAKTNLYPLPSDDLKPVTKEIKTGDFNTLLKTGFYVVNSSTNAPTTATTWALIITNSTGIDNANYVQQIAINQSDHTKMYVRRKNSSTWQPWVIFNAFTDEIKGKVDSYDLLDTAKGNVYKERLNVDFNTVTKGGIYAINSSTNAPTTSTNWAVIVTNAVSLDNTNSVQQIAILNTDHTKMYVRRKNNAVWTSWEVFNAFTEAEKAKLTQYDELTLSKRNIYIEVAANDTNFNDLNSPGMYEISTSINSPTGAMGNWVAIVLGANNFLETHIQQIVLDASIENGKVYIRKKINGAWQSWATYNQFTDAEKTKLSELNYIRNMTETAYNALSEVEKNRLDVVYGTYK